MFFRILACWWECSHQRAGKYGLSDFDEKKTKEAYANGTMEKWQKLSAKFDCTIEVKTNEGKTYGIEPLLGTGVVHNNQALSSSLTTPTSPAHKPRQLLQCQEVDDQKSPRE